VSEHKVRLENAGEAMPEAGWSTGSRPPSESSGWAYREGNPGERL